MHEPMNLVDQGGGSTFGIIPHALSLALGPGLKPKLAARPLRRAAPLAVVVLVFFLVGSFLFPAGSRKDVVLLNQLLIAKAARHSIQDACASGSGIHAEVVPVKQVVGCWVVEARCSRDAVAFSEHPPDDEVHHEPAHVPQ